MNSEGRLANKADVGKMFIMCHSWNPKSFFQNKVHGFSPSGQFVYLKSNFTLCTDDGWYPVDEVRLLDEVPEGFNTPME